MKKERIVLAFIAGLIGLLVAGIIFYIYESTKTFSTKPSNNPVVTQQEKSAPLSIFLTVSKPVDESVVEKKVVEVSGKTKPDATIVILTSLDEEVVAPTADGDFSTTVNIDNGQNLIEITAIAKDGAQQKIIRTVTFSTEKF
ncbi:MAG: hypothetical protein HYU48_00770 [Candidatus Levybacteria bacterium]|nr:hypothetical protein [Candidatus Levybacteria bacterium]